ncbi:hypothetical protein Dimus_039580 [Dionaea muscipula]
MIFLCMSLFPEHPRPRPSPPIPTPPPLHVYTRGTRSMISWGSVGAPKPAPTDPAPSSLDAFPGASPPSDLDVHIVLRKGQRSCATYPLCAHISYTGVSSSLQTFLCSYTGFHICSSFSFRGSFFF